MTSEFPTQIRYGYVAARYLLAIGDTLADDDDKPDAVAPSGSIKFRPYVGNVAADGPPPVGVLPQIVTTTIDADGDMVDPAGAKGVWLITGAYSVSFAFTGVTIPPFDIIVTDAHTKESPLYLSKQQPIIPGPTEIFVVNKQVYEDTLAARDQVLNTAMSVASQASTAASAAGTATAKASDASTSAATAARVATTVATSVATLNALADTYVTANIVAPYTIPGTGTVYNLTLKGSFALTLPTSNGPRGFVIRLIQDATGTRTVTWPSNVVWGGGVSPVLSATPNVADEIVFTALDAAGTKWLGQLAQAGYLVT